MTTKAVATRCVDEIKRKMSVQTRLFVAITGDSGSGKSYYSTIIRELLDQQKITHSYLNADDFLISRADREPMKSEYYDSGEFVGHSKWEILENMFRLTEFRRVLNELRTVGKSSYRPYSRDTGMVDENLKHIEIENLMIVDTSMLLDEMDYVIMVDVEIEKIIARKIARDSDIRTPAQIEEMHRKVQGYYWQRMKPSNPDIIIDNNDIVEPKIIVNTRSRSDVE